MGQQNAKTFEIPERFSTSWKQIIQRTLDCDDDTWFSDIGVAIVVLGLGLYRCGGDRFTRRLPMLAQLTDVFLAGD
jgi:hypothetical protein